MSCHLDLTKKQTPEGDWYYELIVQPDVNSSKKISLAIHEESNLGLLSMAFRTLGDRIGAYDNL